MHLHQSTGFQMEHLSRAALQGAAYLYHLAAGVNAGQKAALAQSVA